jgi:hypothetical protein
MNGAPACFPQITDYPADLVGPRLIDNEIQLARAAVHRH